MKLTQKQVDELVEAFVRLSFAANRIAGGIAYDSSSRVMSLSESFSGPIPGALGDIAMALSRLADSAEDLAAHEVPTVAPRGEP